LNIKIQKINGNNKSDDKIPKKEENKSIFGNQTKNVNNEK